MERTQPLSTHFNACVLTLADRVLPMGFDVSPDAPQNFIALQAHYDKTGRVAVWDGASDKTIFGDAEVNYAFRAWHDAIHLRFALPFTLAGERAVADVMKQQVRAQYGAKAIGSYFCQLIECEVVGQAEYKQRHGEFPQDQVAFAETWLIDHDVYSPFTDAPDFAKAA